LANLEPHQLVVARAASAKDQAQCHCRQTPHFLSFPNPLAASIDQRQAAAKTA
jgi:hypothetical protein